MPPSTPPPGGGAVKNLYSRPQIKHLGRAFHPPSILGPIPHTPFPTPLKPNPCQYADRPYPPSLPKTPARPAPSKCYAKTHP